MPPALSAQELQAIAEPRNLQWRGIIEREFADWWQRYGCFPHPRRHDEWLDELADRLGISSGQEEHVLYGLAMERVELYSPVENSSRGGLFDGAEDWMNDLMGRRLQDDLFCAHR
jgi:hypothetical protein